MQIIVFGDVHMAAESARNIPGVATADLLVVNGDLTNYGGKKEARGVLDELLALNPRLLAQFGNLDHPEINDYLEELGLNLHGQAKLIQGRLCLVGVGGSNLTPFHTPSEFAEPELHALAEEAFRQGQAYTALAEPLHGRRIPTIFISHTPPHDTLVDRLGNGMHVGSTAIRSIIEQYRPALCVTGHIHEARGIDHLGDTPVINPGMLGEGGWLRIDLKGSELETTLS